MSSHKGGTFLRSISPRRSRHAEHNSGSEDEQQPMERRHSSRRMRAVSLRKQKTHEAPQDDDESMIAEWGLTKAQEVRGRKPACLACRWGTQGARALSAAYAGRRMCAAAALSGKRSPACSCLGSSDGADRARLCPASTRGARTTPVHGRGEQPRHPVTGGAALTRARRRRAGRAARAVQEAADRGWLL